ncbi:MAG: DUF4279 domain-containing protein [Lysobacter sp.]|nr:MAG: DUF4279 domain-containing protein [Lysobacter sp.]
MFRDYRYTVSLRIWHPTAHPDRFTEALRLTPDAVDIAGQPRMRKGRVMPIVAKTSYWCCGLGHDPALDVAAFLHERARALSPHRAVFDAIAEEGGWAEFFVGFFAEDFNCGFDLSPELQRVCAELHLSLGFDVYGYRAEEVEDESAHPHPPDVDAVLDAALVAKAAAETGASS